ncbi:hypothetical protein [Delftia tsuruhatensis]|uniref:hypothetical protein n=1 Tax=Delftia tsuruhatensis TaxID=180282 RepID=UPI0028A7B5E4|nr:hypothetical protein [Delftia tsuruhatensis]
MLREDFSSLFTPRVEFIVISICSILVVMIWVAAQGGAVSWDAFNHHIYLGRQAINGSRLLFDHFAVGGMSCQYPLGYAPLVAMLDAGWSGTAIFQMLAFLAALCAPACWLVMWSIVPFRNTTAFLIRLAGTILALSGVLWWKLLPQTSNDAIGMTFAVWSITLTMLCIDGSWWTSRPRIRMLACSLAGALAGIGLVIKLTQLVGVLSAVCILLFANTSWLERCKYIAIFGATALVIVLLTGWSWGYDSWIACGSPIYPFLLEKFKILMPESMK